MEPSLQPSQPRKERRYDLDWLRVFAVLLLVPFHSALVFNLDPNSIVYMKDVVQSDFLAQMAGFIHRWHMPLLFFIAGASTWLALGFRTSGQYLKERVLRLLVPFAFCLAVLIPPMTYVHLIDSVNPPTFWQHFAGFWTINPNELSGLGGTWTPAHLWFILYLFIFSATVLPLFLDWRRGRAQRFIETLAAWSTRPGVILIMPALALTLISAVQVLGDKNPFFYVAVFIFGGLLMTDPRFQHAIDRHLWAALLIGIAAVVTDYLAPSYRYPEWSWPWMALGIVYNLSRWVWVVAFLGAGHRVLNRTNKVLAYASEAAYPFYLLHLPIDTLVTYYVIKLEASIAVKYTLIVLVTIVLTLAAYEIFVKRVNFTRFLFGMKPRVRTAAPPMIEQKA